MESAGTLVDLIAFFTQAVKRIFEAVGKFGTEYDSRSLEAYVEAQMKAVGAVILETAWRLRMKGIAAPDSRPCACGHTLHYMGRRPCSVQGVVGNIELSERHYYYCDHCQNSEFLGDELRGAGRFTQLAEERMALAGMTGAYAAAAKQLKRLGVLSVAGSTIRKVCVRLGKVARAQMDAAAAACVQGKTVVLEKVKRLAIGVDGTMVGRIDPQHRRRKARKSKRKVRGKGRLHHFFHEVKTLVSFEFDQAGQALNKTYCATQARVEEFRMQVAREAAQRGADTATVLVFLGDGAGWVWKTAKELFPRAVQVLDWYHATEHLWAAGRARFAEDEKALWAWVEQRKQELWNGRVDDVIAALRETSKVLGLPDQTLDEKARERNPRWIAFRNIGYFEENRGRMNYPQYRQEGLPIGSGVVESSCKHVVGDRLKRTGMRWDEEGAEDILALRSLDLSERWDSLWTIRAAA